MEWREEEVAEGTGGVLSGVKRGGQRAAFSLLASALESPSSPSRV